MEEHLEFFRKAQKISDEVIPFAKSLIKPNAKLLDITESIENKIKEFAS